MSNKMVKWISGSLVAMGALIAGCSESNTSEPLSVESDGTYLKNDSKQIWARINATGSIATYFDSLSKEGGVPTIGVSSRSSVRCDAPALKMDENTRYLDELESLFDEGEQVEGVCGKALKLKEGQVAPLGVNLIDSLSVGTVEFWFRPDKDFFDKNARTLLGNDGARIHFFYKDGNLYFQKNHHDQHFYAYGEAELKRDDWNLIAGQWGDGYMSLWLNGKLVAKIKHDKGYVPALRGVPFENLVVIGYKSSCCMEGPGQYESLMTSGSYDQVKISNIPRYQISDTAEVKQDSLAADTVPEIEPFVPNTKWIVDYEFNNPKNVGQDFSGNGYHAIVDEGSVSSDSGLAYFNGKSGLTLAEGKDIKLGDFVVEARVYPESVSGYRNIIVTEPPGHGPDGWILRIENGSLKFFVRDADWLKVNRNADWQEVSVGGIKANQWLNIRVECTSKSVALFLNDTLKLEKEIVGNYDSLLYPWGIGYDAVEQSNHSRYFLGAIDYIRVGRILGEDVPVDTIAPIDTTIVPVDTIAPVDTTIVPVDTIVIIDTVAKDLNRKCSENALVKDDKTLYFDEFESEYNEGTLVDGVCGKAISLTDGEDIKTEIELSTKIPVGTAEFWFRPGENFDMETPRTLLGNDGSRLHFFVKDGELIFQKNLPDEHHFVKAAVTLKNDWNLIAGQWGDGYISLWLNGEKVASVKHSAGYVPSTRPIVDENLVVVGYKSSCCMEGAGQRKSMTTDGAFDQLRISSVLRYGVDQESADAEK